MEKILKIKGVKMVNYTCYSFIDISCFASKLVLLKLINFLRPAKGVGKTTHPSPC